MALLTFVEPLYGIKFEFLLILYLKRTVKIKYVFGFNNFLRIEN